MRMIKFQIILMIFMGGGTNGTSSAHLDGDIFERISVEGVLSHLENSVNLKKTSENNR